MAKKASVYTRTGDKGTTGLVGGTRIPKSDLRIDLYGEVDELNSHLGVAISSFKAEKINIKFEALINSLTQIQSRLFDLGSNLACESENREKFQLPQIEQKHIDAMESSMDEMDSELVKLKSFILPGGHIVASDFHVCRTVCRRVERKLVEFGKNSEVEIPNFSREYINRLSDFFFIVSRFVNHRMSEEEILWLAHEDANLS